MTLRLTRVHFAAAALAVAAITLSGPAARAFTQENLSVGGDGSSKFADPDDQVKNLGQGAHLFGQNGPVVQFGAQQGTLAPYHFNGFNGFNSGPTPPDPYARPLGNGD
jgi:hypothetical protein